MIIPNELDCETHMIEYLPGTYGDFVCAIISYSVDDFFDPCDPNWTEENRYWRVRENTPVSRNKYPLSCRGSGYEHVEKYTELMISHKMFLDYPDFFKKNHNYKKVMFNTHPRMLNDLGTHSRTVHNAFTNTQIKVLTIDTDFDSILMASCNEYYTSTTDSIVDTDFNHILHKFKHTLQNQLWFKNNIPEEHILDIGDIMKLTSDKISCYGNVNQDRFNEYFKEYYSAKLKLLYRLTKQCKRDILETENLKHKFESEYNNVIRENT